MLKFILGSLITIAYSQMAISQDGTSMDWGIVEINYAQKQKIVLSFDTSKDISLRFPDGKHVNFKKGKFNLSFVQLEGSIIMRGEDWSKKLDSHSLTSLQIGRNSFSFMSNKSKRIFLHVEEYNAMNEAVLKVIRKVTTDFVKNNNLNWGEIKNIKFQNEYKRYIVSYEKKFEPKVGREILRSLFVEELNLSVSQVSAN